MTTVGHYEVRELLGEGGIGQVHVALDTVLNREVALKSLRPELLSDSNFSDRFRAEATSLARLNHPNITTLYSLLPDGRNLYMVMELVRGHGLDAILEKRRGPLAAREALAIIAQAADGLGYAHSMGVIHRDIKPSNLMVAENGLVKVMDFGIARVRGSQRLTRDGSIVGTLAYMAPEQLRGEPGDERSDIYSLAIVLYEMLSGAPPFQAESDYDIMQAQINKRPERLSPRVAGLDPRIETALMRALAKKPEQRFASMRAFSDALGASALRLDAPKILHDDTRLIAPHDLPILAPRSGLSRVLPSSTGARIGVLLAVAVLVAGGVAGARMFVPAAEPPKMAMAPATQGAGGPMAPRTVATKPAPAKPTTVALAPPTQPSGTSATTARAAPERAAPERAASALAAPATVSPAATAPSAAAPERPADETPPAEKRIAERSPPEATPAETNPPSNAGTPATSPAAGSETGAPQVEQAPAASISDVMAAIKRKDYAKVAELALPLAEAGDREAQFILGRLYDLGQGVAAADPAQAVAWYQKAADQGLGKAQYYLGLMYENGRGVPKNYEQAVALYRKAAIQGDAVAQNDIGIMYSVGQGVPRDDKQAVVWYQMSADQGYAKAQKNLGDMYLLGRGVARDDQQAMLWYLKAAQQGHAEAQYVLGYMFEKGRATAQDEKQALDWYQKAAQGGSPEGQKALERLRPRVGGNQ